MRACKSTEKDRSSGGPLSSASLYDVVYFETQKRTMRWRFPILLENKGLGSSKRIGCQVRLLQYHMLACTAKSNSAS
jgi:hypothetical protein